MTKFSYESQKDPYFQQGTEQVQNLKESVPSREGKKDGLNLCKVNTEHLED